MSKNYWKDTLTSKTEEFYKKNKSEIVDIILFGSVMKGKEKPNDVDLLIIFKEKKNLDLAHKLKSILRIKTDIPIEITIKTYSELFKKTFHIRESILTEGYSILNKINLSEGFGYKSMIMFQYQLKGKTNSERMRFYYSLYGRNSKGMLERLQAVKFTDTVIMCPVDNQEKMHAFLDSWEIEFKEIPLLIPLRLV
ncbi:MAG: nucleotidyltransferase domain-containing protein [archaeon]|nr:nucleotidyltransferase domain-containing protein [Nanoarchaeota archaeon]